jgi:ribonucleotide reductase alpha subunit
LEDVNVIGINNNNRIHNMRADILQRRYLKKDEKGKVIEIPVQMYRRVANAVAASEIKYGATDAQIK